MAKQRAERQNRVVDSAKWRWMQDVSSGQNAAVANEFRALALQAIDRQNARAMQ